MPAVRVARSAALRRRYGVDCQFWRFTTTVLDSSPTGTVTEDQYDLVGTYRVLTKEVATNLTGAGFLPKTQGTRLADADSRTVEWTPLDFAPYTAEVAPQTGDRFVLGGFLYEITHVRGVGVGGDTEAWLTSGFKVLP